MNLWRWVVLYSSRIHLIKRPLECIRPTPRGVSCSTNGCRVFFWKRVELAVMRLFRGAFYQPEAVQCLFIHRLYSFAISESQCGHFICHSDVSLWRLSGSPSPSTPPNRSRLVIVTVHDKLPYLSNVFWSPYLIFFFFLKLSSYSNTLSQVIQTIMTNIAEASDYPSSWLNFFIELSPEYHLESLKSLTTASYDSLTWETMITYDNYHDYTAAW